ncbi:protein NLP1-like [Wolffia australiana]
MGSPAAAPESHFDLDLIDELFAEDAWLGFPISPDVPQLASSQHHPQAVGRSENLGDAEINLEIREIAEVGTSNQLSMEKIEDSGRISSFQERIARAIGWIKDASRENEEVLIQIWVPTERENKRVLTTYGQPFSLNPDCQRLIHYRSISTNYQFPAEENSSEIRGLPGRVFVEKVPEWSPDVRYFSSQEYARVNYAQHLDLRGTLALPIFEPGNQTCVGVLELVLTTEKINYRTDLENICNALKAVDLRSSQTPSLPLMKIQNDSYTAALTEISSVLRIICQTHNLPLAQTWVPCIQEGKTGGRHSDQNYQGCVSTIDRACYINNYALVGFQEACSEHHLLRGQGVVGQAFTTNQPCFSPNICDFSKAQYPLSHHARIFGLRAAVAIRLRSVASERCDFVLEFFLPADCVAIEEQTELLHSLSVTMRSLCRTLRVVTEKELQEEACGSSSRCIFEISEKGKEAEGFTEAGDSSAGKFEAAGKGKVAEKKRTKMEKVISLDLLQQHFSGSLKDAAKSIGVCPTTLKRICRQHGIPRWPSRKIKKVDHSLRKLEMVIKSIEGVDGPLQLSTLCSDFPKPEPAPIPGPAHENTFTNDPPPVSDSISSSSCHSSDSSPSSSLPAHYQGPSFFTRSQSDTQLCRSMSMSLGRRKMPTRPEKMLTLGQPGSRGTNGRTGYSEGLRVKATHGKEKVRFRLQPSWRLRDLRREIGSRFGVDSVELKYLDDDLEWVLLTCDADLEECRDIHHSSAIRTVKISVVDPAAEDGSATGSRSIPTY